MKNKLLEYELRNVDELIPYINNARTHSDEQISKVMASIKEFGFLNPILISEENVITAGHCRLMAAKKLGMDKVPCIKENYLTPAQRKAYVIADNQLALGGGWNEELLAIELSDLQGADFDLDVLGFDEKELSKIFDEGLEGEDDDFDIEAELKKPCITKEGDIWHIGRHKVICGDSTKEETYLKLLGETKVNLVCTDPPYLVNLESTSGKIKNDDLNDKEGYEFLLLAFSNCKNSMAKDASIYVFYATMKARIFYDAYEDAGFKVGAGLIWKKPRAPLMRTDWKFNMEPIIWGWRKDGKHIWYGDQKQKAVFEFDSITNSKEDGHGHPSSKPIPLILYLIKQCTQTNGLVLDAFLGSASTLIACEQSGRICYGIELEAKFVDVAVKRYIELTGTSDDIYVERNGEKIPYAEVKIDESINSR